MLIKDYGEFAKELQKFHLSKPKLSLDFEDCFDDELKELLRDMDKAILKIIWKVNPLSKLNSEGKARHSSQA